MLKNVKKCQKMLEIQKYFGRTDGRMDGQTDGQTDGWMDGWMDGRMDGWTDGWMDGQKISHSTGLRPLSELLPRYSFNSFNFNTKTV